MEDLLKHLGISEDQFAVHATFHRYAIEKVSAALQNKTRFVHYTNADTAMRMFTNREVWLRKSTQMNDFMEVDHGLHCLSQAYRKYNEDIKTLFNGMFPDVCDKIEEHFNGWLPTYKLGTYLTCVSEHDDTPERNEDRMGRLSMWRAYGGFSGVAIVMKGDVFHKPIESDALKAYVSPVAYLSVDHFEQQFLQMISNIQVYRDQLIALGADDFFARVSQSFRFAILCTKHPGFLEEREWRIIYSPAMHKSDVIKESIESIAGVPQKVCKLPLVDRPELGISGITLPDIIDRVIVGPTLYPFDVAEALTALLEGAGVENASSKVVVSEIPLRQVR